ncbi:MAG: hypothetical protein ACI9Y1_003487, partial [Lentisphaeria bacterium]
YWTVARKERDGTEIISNNSNSHLAIDSDSNWSLNFNAEDERALPNETINNDSGNSPIDSDSNWQASDQ